MANTLAAELILDISKFRKGLRDAQNSAASGFKGGVGGNIASGILKSGGLITGALVTVVTAAAGIAAYRASKIIAQGIAQAGEHEKLQMRFEILTGSRGAGNRTLNTLREDALRTGVAMEDMASNVSKFVAFGFNTDEALKLNKGILDVGGSVGLSTSEMKLLGVALSQVAAKGVANMEELRQQIAEKGIPIFKALEQQLGVTGAELNQMIQEGKVSSDVVLNMFKGVPDGTGPFARFAGGAERLGNTFPGMIARMKTAWAEFLRVLGNPIIDALKPMMNNVLTNMAKLVPLAEKWGQSIADAVSTLTAIGQVLATVPWETYAEIFQAAFFFAIKQLGNYFMKVMAGVTQAVMVYWLAIGKMFLKLIDIVRTPTFWSAVGKEMANVAIIWLDLLMTGLSKLMTFMKDSAKAAWSIFTGGGDVDVKVPDLFGGNEADGPGLDALIEEAVNGYLTAINGAKDAFVDGFTNAGDTFDTSSEGMTLGDTLAPLLKKIREQAEKLKEEQRAATAERNRTDGDEPSDGSNGGGGGGGTGALGAGFALNGRMSQAMNIIAGRSAFDVIAQAQVRAEVTQREIKKEAVEQNKKLDGILKVIKTPPPRTPSSGGATFD